MIKSRVKEADEVDITPMIDMVFQLIIFFMVVMAIAVVYGVAIKFPPPGKAQKKSNDDGKKRVNVYVQQDRITNNHYIMHDGILKINGEEIALTRSSYKEYEKRAQERKEGFDKLQEHMQKLVDKGYDTEILFIRGDMKSYHGKIMRVIDRGKRVSIPGETDTDPVTGEVRPKVGFDGFSLVPPQ